MAFCFSIATIIVCGFTDTASAQNLILNPGFESGTNPWQFYTNGVANFSNNTAGEQSLRAGMVLVSQPGTNMQLYQTGIRLQANTWYRLRFRVVPGGGGPTWIDRPISVSIHKHTAPYTSYGLNNLVFPFNRCDRFAWAWVEFKTAGFIGTVNDARLRFTMNPYFQSGDTLIVDDVELLKEPYSVTQNLVRNPGFWPHLTPWTFHTDGSAFATTRNYPVSCAQGGLDFDVVQPGTNTQLSQNGIRLEPNSRYRVSVAAEIEGTASVYIHGDTPPYTNYGLQGFVVGPGNTQWETEFTTRGFSAPVSNARIRLSFMTPVGGFLYAVSLQKVISKESAGREITPAQFSLGPNYPNPFNPVTVISYDLPVTTQVSLKVYDLLGKEITALVDGMQDAGFKSVEFDASNLASGVYLYRLQAGDFVATRKLVVVK